MFSFFSSHLLIVDVNNCDTITNNDNTRVTDHRGDKSASAGDYSSI